MTTSNLVTIHWPPTWEEGLDTDQNLRAVLGSFIHWDPEGGSDFIATLFPLQVTPRGRSSQPPWSTTRTSIKSRIGPRCRALTR